MLLSSVLLKRHQLKGKALFAARCIPLGTIVWLPCSSCKRYSEEDLKKQSFEKLCILDELGYRDDNNGIILPCKNACYMNHSCNANVLDFGLDFGIAVQDIEAEEEVCCDYHTWNNEEWKMVCQCGTSNCKKLIYPRLDDNLKEIWIAKINIALCLVKYMKQPLHKELLQDSKIYKLIMTDKFEYMTDDSEISVKKGEDSVFRKNK